MSHVTNMIKISKLTLLLMLSNFLIMQLIGILSIAGPGPGASIPAPESPARSPGPPLLPTLPSDMLQKISVLAKAVVHIGVHILYIPLYGY